MLEQSGIKSENKSEKLLKKTEYRSCINSTKII
jgi:hypothetical protein